MTEKKAIIEAENLKAENLKAENLKAGWHFDNSYARLPKSFYTDLNPSKVPSPTLMVFNQPLATTLGLNAQALMGEEGAYVFAGNRIPEGAFPLAQAYAGHQFGNFNMLGDGRAILLGEQMTPLGQRFDIQLKGSGKTPYSRGGDGRAALGPMLREYIISEAMHGLGIPTTRSLAVVTTGEAVMREVAQSGAVLTRVAESHLRVGTFQYVSKWGTEEELRILADYTLNRHFRVTGEDENPYLFLLKEVIKGQAELIAKWQLVGFIHGVMNTDNMALSGESIDFGPCAFMDVYDPATVFSSIDRQGRYAYGNQPNIAAWNLARFAETLLPLLHTDQAQAIKMAQDAIADFSKLFMGHWSTGMRAKLGLINEEPQDDALIEELLSMMHKHGADYTNTFIALTFNQQPDMALFGTSEFALWHEKWQGRIGRQQVSSTAVSQLMKNSNPAIIPRNHRVEEALAAAVEQGDYGVMEALLRVLSNPFEHSEEQVEYALVTDASKAPYKTFCGT